MFTYDNIQITLAGNALEKNSLRGMEIIKKINEHGKISFSGIVPPNQKENFFEMTDSQTKIEVTATDINKTHFLFKGVVTNIELKQVQDIYYFEIQGLSHSYELDIKLRNRSFQDKSMEYKALVKEVIADYQGADFIYRATEETTLDQFILQYQETDWEFLKRIASHFNTGLVPAVDQDKPKFWFGLPEGADRQVAQENSYIVKKRIFDYRNSKENYSISGDENDYIYYEMTTKEFFDIGDNVNFRSKEMFVYQSTARIEGSMLKMSCILTPKLGLDQSNIYNYRIIGASLEGKVIDIKEDFVRLHLAIDKKQDKEKAYWFPYSTFYTAEGYTGWYCMPELNDCVTLNFPTKEETDGVVINSVRKHTKTSDKVDDPKVKFFRTAFGKEIMFDEKEIVITGKDNQVLIRVNEENGIEVYSSHEVKITGTEGIKIESENDISIIAGTTIEMTCKSSSITMNGDTHICGENVKTN